MADLRSAMVRPALDQSATPAADISWMMLDRFVFTEVEKELEVWANPFWDISLTSLGAYFSVGLCPAAPPVVSRLCVHWYNDEGKAAEVVTADQGLFLLRVTSPTESNIVPYQQDYFVFRAGTRSLLKRLPACKEQIVLPLGLGDGAIRMERLFHNNTLALVSSISSDDEFEFAVVQLAKFVDMPGSSRRKGAEICVFRSSKCNASRPTGSFDKFIEDEGKWEILTRPINHMDEEFSDFKGWSTDGTIIFNDYVCWFDYYHGGILLYNIGERFIKYVRLPINDRPTNSLPSGKHLEMYRSLCVTGQRGSQLLRFVDVARDDRCFYGPLGKGCTFTITYHTFGPISPMDHGWDKDVVVVTSRDLDLDGCKRLMPRKSVPTFPLVSRDEPHLIHFLMSEPRKQGQKIDKVSVVVIDVSKKAIVSVTPYIQGDEDLCGKDAKMVRHRSRLPWSFLPFQF